ncbi:MAG: hypothetical protein DRJ20_02045 [Candidatus Methanomethylicota archaeon]|uniref:KaiC-like domain-containing protein n=1 Tax=Thermoproteota archaeon TaxID=2056631 RepID=A0A497EXZ1_9CREN|nr:MAG: hypothetical protein DRJ20_02045 [Candidatus Verstraetearchaeota archaeon]
MIRKKIAIPGFSEMYGTIPDGSVILLLGEPGSGNDIFALQALYSHALENGKVAYLTADTYPEDIIEEMQAYGWDYNKVKSTWKFIDAYSTRNIKEKVEELITYAREGYWTTIDTITKMWENLSITEIVKITRKLREAAREGGGIHFLVAMKGEVDIKDERKIKRIADGLIEFTPLAEHDVGILRILKMRRRAGNWLTIPYRITQRGIEIETTMHIV